MLLKEFPDVLAVMDEDLGEIHAKIPDRLFRTLEMFHQKKIPNTKYSIKDLESLMKSLILRQLKQGRGIVRGGCWSLFGVDWGMPRDDFQSSLLFPTYAAISLMTLFRYRYPSRARRLPGFRNALHNGLNFSAEWRLEGHGMCRNAQKIQTLRILEMGQVFRYVVEHVDEYPLCRPFYDVLVDCKEDMANQNYRIPKEIISLREALTVLPDSAD